MAAAGEPLKRRHGVLLYSAQPTKDLAVTPATAIGMATPRVTSDSGMNNVFGLGSASLLFMRPGLMQVPISIPIDHLQSKAFLLRAQRSSGAVLYNTLGIGYRDDAGTMWARQVDNCKILSVDLSVDAGGPVTATFNIIGDLITELTTLAPANLTEEPFKWYDGLFTKDAAAFEAESFRTSLNHNITPTPVLHGTAATTRKRSNKYFTEGYEDVTGEFSRFAKSGISLQADTIADFALVAAFTNGANTLTLTYAGAKFLSEEDSFGDDIRFNLPFRAKTLVIS